MLNNELLSFVSSNKYLGMIVHDKLDDEEDIMRHVKRLYATGNMLISRSSVFLQQCVWQSPMV